MPYSYAFDLSERVHFHNHVQEMETADTFAQCAGGGALQPQLVEPKALTTPLKPMQGRDPVFTTQVRRRGAQCQADINILDILRL